MPSHRIRRSRPSRSTSREDVRFEQRPYYIRNTGRYSRPGSFLYPPHYHDAIEVVAIPGDVRGSVTAGGRKIALTDAHFIAVPPNMIHSFDLRSKDGKPFILVQIDLDWAVHALTAFAGSESVVREGLSHLISIVGPRAATLYRSLLGLSTFGLSPMGPHYSGSVEAAAGDMEIMAVMLGAITSSKKPHVPQRESRPLRDAIDFIEKNSSENLDLDRIAGQTSWSKYHLCREFKVHTGWTLRDYLNHQRISRAKALFDGGERNVSTVAYACGFSDPSHFTKVFSRYAGVRPKRYVLGRECPGE